MRLLRRALAPEQGRTEQHLVAGGGDPLRRALRLCKAWARARTAWGQRTYKTPLKTATKTRGWGDLKAAGNSASELSEWALSASLSLNSGRQHLKTSLPEQGGGRLHMRRVTHKYEHPGTSPQAPHAPSCTLTNTFMLPHKHIFTSKQSHAP